MPIRDLTASLYQADEVANEYLLICSVYCKVKKTENNIGLTSFDSIQAGLMILIAVIRYTQLSLIVHDDPSIVVALHLIKLAVNSTTRELYIQKLYNISYALIRHVVYV